MEIQKNTNGKFNIIEIEQDDLNNLQKVLDLFGNGIIEMAKLSKPDGIIAMKSGLDALNCSEVYLNMTEQEFEEYYDNEIQIGVTLVKLQDCINESKIN